MACPLSAILNTEDLSPQKTHGQNVTDEVVESTTPGIRQADPSTPDPSNSKIASYGMLSRFVLSPNRGALYHRRASKSSTHVQNPPTPPESDPPVTSDPPVHWFDDSPPSHEVNVNRFSAFQALLGHPELTFEVAKHLDIEDLISLYAISKDFHILVNGRFTALILAQSLGKAAESSRTFLFKCYKNLCIHDPAARPNLEVFGEIRCVPSFRWLRMILFREKVVDEIISCITAEGHRLPKRASLVIKKIWFTMDISDNARRIGLIHNKTFWENKDLFVSTLFFIKLDMRLTDPVDGNGETKMRKMLFAQRSLSTLWKVLKRKQMLTQYEMLQMFVRWKYRPAPEHSRMSICGVPAREVGRGQLEGWGSGRTRLLRPDELIMREGIRRKMDLHKRYLDMMLWGYVDKKTFEDIWVTASDGEDEGTSASETGDSMEDGAEEQGTDPDEQGEMDYASFNLG